MNKIKLIDMYEKDFVIEQINMFAKLKKNVDMKILNIK